MPLDFNGALTYLFDCGIIIAGAVVRGSGEIVHISNNWSLDPTDVKQCLGKWKTKGQYVMLQDIKYALLMNRPEYFSGVNYKTKAWVIGAASPPDEAGEPYYVIGYAPAGSNGTNAYVDVVRAANLLKEGGSYIDPNAKLGKAVAEAPPMEVAGGGGAAAAPAPAGAAVDPAVKAEVEGFVKWIKDPEGLAGYIRYYIDQNNADVIAKLAKAYSDFRSVFGF